jgi:hypothetical protein
MVNVAGNTHLIFYNLRGKGNAEAIRKTPPFLYLSFFRRKEKGKKI